MNKEQKNEVDKLVAAIAKDDAVNASKHLDSILHKRCAKKIFDTLEALRKE